MQAEPLEAHTPSRSSAIKIVSELKPGKLTFRVLARRFTQRIAILLRRGKNGGVIPQPGTSRIVPQLARLLDQRAPVSGPLRRRGRAGNRGCTFSVPGRR